LDFEFTTQLARPFLSDFGLVVIVDPPERLAKA
jgi:hypothetical protein